MNSPSDDPLLFPSIEWFQTLQQLVNADPEFRRLGTIDAVVGIKAGSEICILTFQALQCETVRVGTDDDLFEVDFYLEMSEEQWQEMLENIKQHGRADLSHTLNTLDLRTPGGIASNVTGEQLEADLFFRYNESLQYFFDLSAQIQTTFRNRTPP
ncbi:hypothetical protein NKDENANG_01467 [Candidatus Entotheonellaceae bacterium PAL068K]